MLKDKNIIEHHYKAINMDEFTLTLKTKIRNKLMKFIFDKCIIRMKRLGKHDKKKSHNFSDIKKFDLDPMYYKLMRLAINGHLKKLFEEFEKDKIRVKYYEVQKGFYYRDPDNSKIWNAEIIITGTQVDER